MVDSVTGLEPPHFPILSEKVQSVAWANADGFVRYFSRARREVQSA